MYRIRFLLLLAIFSLSSINVVAEDSLTAIQNAAGENKYLYIFFYKDQNDKTKRAQAVFNQATEKLGGSVRTLQVKANDPSEKAIIDRFNLKRSPMPFVVVLAPNGAITGGYPLFTEEQLTDALVSPGGANCLKALQDRKLVLLCLQSRNTANNDAALKGVNEFKADPRFNSATEIVMIDPSNQQEQKFLNQLGLDTRSPQAITVLISPPAEIVAKYQGPTTKTQLASDLQTATSGCCCPGGCCPGGKCCPR